MAEQAKKQPCCTALLAHVDAGKTTLSEMMLYHGGTLRAAGRVDTGNTAMDYDPIERERGITIYSAQGRFCWRGTEFSLLDTPGHPDFSAEMERTLPLLDCAVLVVSALEGVQGHTMTIWRLLERFRIPTLIFVNKTDLPTAEPERVLDEIRARLSADCVPVDGETVAEREETFLETYLEDETADFLPSARKLTMERKLFPVFCGSARNDEGVTALLDGLCDYISTDYREEAPFGGQVYQIRRDKNGVRWALTKVTSGVLRPRMEIGEEKVGEIRLIQGGKSVNLPEAGAGMLCAVSGLTVPAGTALGAAEKMPSGSLAPLMAAKVEFAPEQQTAVLAAFRQMEEEEPALSVRWEEEVSQLSVRVMGAVQLEILIETMQTRFGLAVSFGEPKVIYRETIAAPVRGYGHFEPLRHYAEVHLLLEPLPVGSGIEFQSACPTDFLALNWQRLIETHVFEREHKGVLTGSALTDVRITLISGRAHLKHTEGGDFRQATGRAIRQGLMTAENVLLEPVYEMCCSVPVPLLGRVLSDVQKMSGTAGTPEQDGEMVTLTASVPVSETAGYAAEFASFTRGRGMLSFQPSGWQVCHNPEQVIAESGYDPEHDLSDPVDSVFCSHGAGYTVKWYEAEAAMHLKDG